MLVQAATSDQDFSLFYIGYYIYILEVTNKMGFIQL